MTARVWFTSDTHFNHENVIRYCGRPFANVDEMNAEMVARFNSAVAPNDIVYHLGDVAIGDLSHIKNLNGYKICVQGNHDPGPEKLLKVGFHRVVKQDFVNVVVHGMPYTLWLAHIPTMNVDKRNLTRPEPFIKYDIAVCGHVHHKWLERDGNVNVGVDVWDFYPVSPKQIVRTYQTPHTYRSFRV